MSSRPPVRAAERPRAAWRARLIGPVTCLLTAALATTAYATAQDTGRLRATPAQIATAADAVRAADIAGTAWYTDPAKGRLVVIADRTVDAEEIARITAAVPDPATSLDMSRTPGKIAERTAGGDVITGPGGIQCHIGYNVRNSAGTYALTAGHCTALGGPWSIGPVVDSSFPGNDYGLIEYNDPSQAEAGIRHPGGGSTVHLTGAGTPAVGATVAILTGTTGTHSGRVLALNVTVNYGADGIVSGLVETSVCSEPGDSGSPVFSGSSAVGIVSGGSGNCSSGGETFVQPVTEPLAAYGVTLLL